MASSNSTTGTSTQQVLTALVSNGVIFGVFLSAFLLLRLKLKRIYEPKSSFNLIPDEKKPEPLPSGPYQWFLPLLKKSDSFIIQQAGLDGYFFLRYLGLICIYCGFSMLYLFPILLPVNVVHGRNESGLNKLAYQNVLTPARYYAHIFCGWVFFWLFLYVVYRELYYYNSLRQAVLSSPRYAKKLSSRTVLFQCVPEQYLSEREFPKLFDGVKRVWIARSGKEIENKVKEREDLANNLENSMISLIKSAQSEINKQKKKDPTLNVSNDISDYVPFNKRPKHRLKFLIGKKVDTLDYVKEQLPTLNEEIQEMQANHMDIKPYNSVFVEFESQFQAQIAAQIIPHHAPLSLNPSYVGIEPSQVKWINMRLFPYERLLRKFGAIVFIIALVILWAFPVAFVGMISNITYLTNKLHWLKFIYNLPDVLLGLLTSLAPTVALAILMSFLPKIIRAMAIIQGAPSSQAVEYFTQQAYFAFQVIQVFLVTTIVSSATSVVTQIVQEPTSAMSLLASNLPKSSNFYIAYIILQGMSVSSGALLQLVPLIMFYALGLLLDKTPRKKWNRFSNLSSLDWGTTFPVYTNLAVITFSYAIICPIILLFAFCGFFLLYVAYLYNLTYVMEEAPDGRGIYYPRALFQTLVGVYIGQVCLLGLFAVGKGWGPIVLQVIGIVVTVILHMFLNVSFDHLIKYVPVDTMRPLDGKTDTPSFKNLYTKVTKEGTLMEDENVKVLPPYQIRKYHTANNAKKNSFEQNTISIFSENTFELQNEVSTKLAEESKNNILSIPLLADADETIIPFVPFWKRFILPHIFSSYKAVRRRVPTIYGLTDPSELVDEDDIAHAYDYPSVSAKCPYLWIPRDEYGFSKTLIAQFNGIIDISDEGATIDPKNKITWTENPPTYNVDHDPFADFNMIEEMSDESN
ncbi:hypothetical protein TBLA_0B03100 [Henningerozyma blattae CBS 6284]|uniref:Rsn1p n=1 Tax=Henningerozyma blattae (strain ATCC 34711 / CBS 6284 / DSM 70876 / NBRC 10599 / NRRL Y-10934 / UCD 77-7) TaxID=1071380 RepID=I2GYE9_HENB6|nr:hypothetical protein TBLA_0B03100 [Tetrapisispora blattae CBS 6284]CCH59151.1 hypothetical protein TBLA_0B03100 [Tetrapisispora blattae CBS 6284]